MTGRHARPAAGERARRVAVPERDGAGVPAWVRRHRRPAWPGLAIALGTVLLVVAGAGGWRATLGVSEFGGQVLGPAPAGPATGSAVPVVAGGPAVPAVVPPIRLRIPSIRLDATVRPVGVDPATGELDVPPSVDTVGWYRFGPDLRAPAGSVLVAGHVDSATQGPGAFFALRDVAAGARVTVTGADGGTRVFTVVAREVFAKTSVPLDRLFGRDGRLRLTLVTCGGAFDAATRHYRDNVVLTALPA